MERVLLFNATGSQGMAIANRLLAEGYTVIAPTRSKEKVALLKEKKIEAFVSDFSVQSLVPFLKRADKVVLQISAHTVAESMVESAKKAIEAISEAGSPKTVFVISSTISKHYVGVKSVDARLKMVELAQEKIPNTPILSVTEYLENFSTAYRQPIMENGVVPQTIPQNSPVNYLSLNDMATYVLAALKSNKLEGKVYALGGNEGIDGTQFSRRLGKVLSKELIYAPVTHEELEGMLTPIMGAAVAKDYADFYRWQDTAGASLLNPNTEEVRNLLNVKLPTFEQWATEAFQITNKHHEKR
jgi:uncharacterized protein YbjT (DUF2867 family)